MKQLIFLLLSFLCVVNSYAQPITYRSNSSITVSDYNLFAGNSFRIPVYNDTTNANAAYTLDSCGKLIYTYNNKLWYRACSPKRWVLVTLDTTSLSNRINDKIDSLKKKNDSVFFKKNGTWYLSYPDLNNDGRFGNDTATIVMAKVHNDAGSTLTNGEVVFLATSGTNSDVPSVRRANNKADSTSANTFGFVVGSIVNQDTGWVILSGKIEKLNLPAASWSNGDVIYLDSISGKFTKVKPKAPYHLVYLGVVVKANAGNGAIFVKPQNGYELDEIHDVQINTPRANQVIVYSDTDKLWKNVNQNDMRAEGLRLLGSEIKGIGIATPTLNDQYAQPSFLNTNLHLISYYVPYRTTVSGVKWFQSLQGNYTANNFNGIALYSYSNGILTLINNAFCANDGNIWKAATNSFASKAFISPVTINPGIYYIGAVFSYSSVTTQPLIGGGLARLTTVNSGDLTNGAKVNATAPYATLPTTVNMATSTNTTASAWGFFLY